MDLDDILEEEKYDMQTLLSIYEQRELDQEQPLISIKNTKNVFSVEREYVNSKEYHDKFENLQISKTLQESLYKHRASAGICRQFTRRTNGTGKISSCKL